MTAATTRNGSKGKWYLRMMYLQINNSFQEVAHLGEDILLDVDTDWGGWRPVCYSHCCQEHHLQWFVCPLLYCQCKYYTGWRISLIHSGSSQLVFSLYLSYIYFLSFCFFTILVILTKKNYENWKSSLSMYVFSQQSLPCFVSSFYKPTWDCSECENHWCNVSSCNLDVTLDVFL